MMKSRCVYLYVTSKQDEYIYFAFFFLLPFNNLLDSFFLALYSSIYWKFQKTLSLDFSLKIVKEIKSKSNYNFSIQTFYSFTNYIQFFFMYHPRSQIFKTLLSTPQHLRHFNCLFQNRHRLLKPAQTAVNHPCNMQTHRQIQAQFSLNRTLLKTLRCPRLTQLYLGLTWLKRGRDPSFRGRIRQEGPFPLVISSCRNFDQEKA